MWSDIILSILLSYIAIYMISPSPLLKLIIVIRVVDSKVTWQSRERKDAPSKSVSSSRNIYDLQLYFFFHLKKVLLIPCIYRKKISEKQKPEETNHLISTLILNGKTKTHIEFSTGQFLSIKKNFASVKMEYRMYAWGWMERSSKTWNIEFLKSDEAFLFPVELPSALHTEKLTCIA